MRKQALGVRLCRTRELSQRTLTVLKPASSLLRGRKELIGERDDGTDRCKEQTSEGVVVEVIGAQEPHPDLTRD